MSGSPPEGNQPQPLSKHSKHVVPSHVKEITSSSACTRTTGTSSTVAHPIKLATAYILRWNGITLMVYIESESIFQTEVPVLLVEYSRSHSQLRYGCVLIEG